ncbi:hypothetical protein H072_3010 [Dactylellina haptotyla CBS 200.50]|uniref:LicD/FKTN/FKRP nucleotidyltransferase domain-containing protein n=1 Tax=Dactylellina haptotyla (strain CBS 200.50) TaxID=1284197 RepID=S8BU61_DACHA|nr:hypothetical protein H072_3010 [Dactylellina haptotyla CBS 200.50]
MWLMRCFLGILIATQVSSSAAASPRKVELQKNLERNKARTGGKAQPIAWKPASKFADNAITGPKEPKYFHEPGVAAAGHYDQRFFSGFVNDRERHESLRHLIRSWLQWSQMQGVETWLAHGTLLGWWWNSRILPWDTDLDVQISEATLKYLAENFNMTKWSYDFDEENFHGTYLLDINPYWTNRRRGHSSNLIDGRWVDRNTGLFIDITGLSETHRAQRPGVISCKNNHRYNVKEIYPLRDVLFEGFKAYVPYAYDIVLVKEYRSKAFTLTEYEKHQWQPALKSWVQKNSTQPYTQFTLKNGKTIKIKREDPRGLEAVPQPSFMENISRLVHYW